MGMMMGVTMRVVMGCFVHIIILAERRMGAK